MCWQAGIVEGEIERMFGSTLGPLGTLRDERYISTCVGVIGKRNQTRTIRLVPRGMFRGDGCNGSGVGNGTEEVSDGGEEEEEEEGAGGTIGGSAWERNWARVSPSETGTGATGAT